MAKKEIGLSFTKTVLISYLGHDLGRAFNDSSGARKSNTNPRKKGFDTAPARYHSPVAMLK